MSITITCGADDVSRFQKALELRSEGHNGRASDALKKCVALAPNDARAYVHLGATLEDQGKWKEAATAYHRALELDPKDASATRSLEQLISSRTVDHQLPTRNRFREETLHRGFQALEAKEYSKAVEIFRLLRGLFPDDPRPLLYSAEAFELQGNVSQAISLYENAIETFPGYAPARVNLIILLISKGEREAAARHLQKALSIMPDNRRLKYLAGLLGGSGRDNP
jgi:superkiller protein 3